MHITPELLSYIKISLNQGDSREQIGAALKEGGWLGEEITQAFTQVDAGAVTKLSVLVPRKPRDRKGQLITTVAILGSLLLGLGVILMIASNWQDIGRWLKVGLIFTILFLTYGLGYYLEHKRNSPRIGRALVFLGTLMLGAAIVLIQQIFNIVTESDNTMLWWALLIMPIIYGLALEPSLALATILIFVWQFFRNSGNIDLFDIFDLRMQVVNYWYPAILGALLMPLAYRIKAIKVQPLNLIGLGLWLLLACSLWVGGRGRLEYELTRAIPGLLVAVALLYGAAVFCVGRLHQFWPKWKEMEPGYTALSFFFVFFPTFMLSFEELGNDFLSSSPLPAMVATWQSLVVMVALVAVSLVAMWQYRDTAATKRLYQGGNAAVGGVLAMVFAILFFPTTFYVVMFNVLVFVESLWLMWLGYETKDKGFINLGLSFFLLMVLVKYFQWGYELFDRSLFFIGGGLVLIAVSYFGERQRRRMIEQISKTDV
jgi:uncharacterized membrane protein